MAFPSSVSSETPAFNGKVDFSIARRAETNPLELLRTSRELMATLDKHSGRISQCRKEDFVGRYNDYITKAELKAYLVHFADRMDTQDRADLTIVLRDFARIARKDSREECGISYRDMAFFVLENQGNDRMTLLSRENNKLRATNQMLCGSIYKNSAIAKI